jgi:hypothetical protein
MAIQKLQKFDKQASNEIFSLLTKIIVFTIMSHPPVTVAGGSKACTAFARSEAGIVGSNPTQGMDV